MGVLTGLPVVHIDHIHWQAGWVELSPAEKTRLCHEVEARDAWMFEGGHSKTWETRWARADMVIWLDRPVGLRFWRILRRSLRWHGQARPDLPEGCPERFGRETLPFWHYVWATRTKGRDNILRLLTTASPEKSVMHLQTDSQIAAFLAGFAK